VTSGLTPRAGGPPVRVVTVSATYGAGGLAVARLLGQRLHLPFADRLLASAGKSAGTSDERVTPEELDEEPRNPVLEGLALLSTAWSIPVPRDPEDVPEHVRTLIEGSIETLLETGGAVILGRAAAAALAGYPGAFHVRLDGPVDRRARRGSLWESVDLQTAKAHLAETDSARSRTLRRLYGRDPSEPALYHLVIDATSITVDALVDVIAASAEAFWRYDDSQLETLVAKTRARVAELPR
jgi:Cytidylate kinase-like family